MTPVVKTNRQRRALAALAENDGLTVKQLRDIAGQNNIPELMRQLRRNGWRWTCELVEVTDRDGRSCKPGVYRLTSEHRQLATQILEPSQ
jgi:hypothetical protein